jgi:hypothetical protein
MTGPIVFSDKELQDPKNERGVAISEIERLIGSKTCLIAIVTPEMDKGINFSTEGAELWGNFQNFIRDLDGEVDYVLYKLITKGWYALLIEPIDESMTSPADLFTLSADAHGLVFPEVFYLP